MRFEGVVAGALGSSLLLAAPAAAQAQGSLRAAASVIDTRVPELALESAGSLVSERSLNPDSEGTRSFPAAVRRRDLAAAAVFLDDGSRPGAGNGPDTSSVIIVYW